MLTTPFRVPLARELLRQRLSMNVGLNPMSGFWLGDDAADQRDETDDARADRKEYLNGFRAQAVSNITGLIEACLIRVWRARDGGFELAAPLWAAQAFFERNGEMDELYFDRAEWDKIFEQRYPETDLARWGRDDAAGADDLNADGASSDPAPSLRAAWTGEQMGLAIAECSIRNREKAWNEHFKLIRSDHGWPVEAFRSLWATARGTKGSTGRPPKRA